MENQNQELHQEMKIKAGDIIISLNLLEGDIKNIISSYINSTEKSYFIQDVLLNNLIVNFSSKFKVLQYIIFEEKIKVDKDFYNAIKVLMNKRNLIAHCDTILDNYDLDDVGFDDEGFDDEGEIYPIWKEVDPTVSIFENGKLNDEKVLKVFEDFYKYHEIAKRNLEEIQKIITQKNGDINTHVFAKKHR